LKGFETYVNDNGGIGCRKLVVTTWDSSSTPPSRRTGSSPRKSSLAMVGNNALFNPDVAPMTGCVDAKGVATGLPDLAGLTADINETCAPTTYSVQPLGDVCPVGPGERPITQYWGYWKYLLTQFPALKSVFLVPGDLPTTVLASMPIIEGQRQAGIDVVGAEKVSGRDEQAAYTPKVQLVRDTGANMVYDGSNDVAMVKMRRQPAQGSPGWRRGCARSPVTPTPSGRGGQDGTYGPWASCRSRRRTQR
jgi:hypothetical protein